MTILFLTYQGGPAGSTYSISYLARGLSQRGHRVLVGCSEQSLLWQLLFPTEVQLVPMEIRGRFDRRNIRHIRQLTNEYSIDIVNAQSSKDRYTSILARWRYRLPYRLVHTRRQLSKSMRLQASFYQRGTDKIIAVSEGVKQSLVESGIGADHIRVIYNGTPPEKYQDVNQSLTEELRNRYGLGETDIVIGSVGRLKEQDQILQALTLLKQPVKLIFVGIASQPTYEAIQRQYTLPHEVYFTGIVSNADVLAHYPLFTMNVLASTIEGLSQSLLEAMAMGVPVVATNIGGNPELIRSGHNGLLFENNDIVGLARHIQALMDDPALRGRLRTNGRQTALVDFSIERTVDAYEQFFQSLLSS